MNWKQSYSGTIPERYLKDNRDKSNVVLASGLSQLTGVRVSRNAVKKARKRYAIFPRAFSETVNDNYTEISMESSSPITVSQLVEQCEIDLNKFELVSVNPGSWNMAARDETKRIIYEEGKILEGEIHKGGIKVHKLYKLNATFRKRVLEAVQLTVHPVECNTIYPPPVPTYNIYKRALVFSDPHIGYTIDYQTAKLTPLHNRAVLNLILEIARLTQPTSIHILGDVFDFAEQSDKFLTSPEFRNTVQPTIEEAHLYLRWLREICPRSEIFIHEGNHGKRIKTALLKHVNWAYGLKAADEIELPPQLSIPRLLALHKLQIQYVDSYPNDCAIIGGVELTHGSIARKGSGSTVTAIAREATISQLCGHIHKVELASKTLWEGPNSKVIQVASDGCTCWIDGRVPGVKARQNWQNGFAVISHSKNNRSITPYLITNNEVFFEGSLLKAKTYLPQLRKTNNRWNW